MPQVPVYKGGRVQEAGLGNVRVGGDVSAEAFGGGRSEQQVTQSVDQFTGAVGRLADQAKKKADDVAFMSADRQLSEAEIRIQLDSKKMLGKDAAGSPDYAKEQWDKTVEDVSKGLANDDQKQLLMHSSNSRWQSLNNAVQTHTFGQLQQYDENETKGYLETSKSAAVLNADDPGRVGQEIVRQKFMMQEFATRHGIPADSEQFKQMQQDTISGTHQGVISAQIDSGNSAKAAKYFNEVKGEMKAADILTTEKSIKQGQILEQGQTAWKQYGSMRLADGTPDEAAIQAKVMANKSIAPDEREKVWDFVKSRAAEDIANKTRQDQARDRSFMNTAIQARQQGQPLEQAIKLANKFGVDSYDQATKMEAIKKIYAPPGDSDQAVKYKLWEGIQEGKTTSAEIDDALQKNLLNAKDWSAMKEERYKAEVEGRSPEMKSARDRVKQLSVQTFGSDKARSQAFELEVTEAARNKSPDEYWKIANDKIKTDPSTQNHFLWMQSLPFGGQEFYKSDAEKRGASSLAFGKANEDLGLDVVKSIGQGVARKGGKTFTPTDIEAFSQEFGGYQNIKPGTPVHNAIQSLMRRNKPIVPENIKAVLAQYPDGAF